MQRRLKKYSRDLDTRKAVSTRQITDTSLAVIATIHDYRIIPTSLLVRLVSGNEKNIARHLHQLYHKGLVNRFAFIRGRNPGEFHYYLDNTGALDLLVDGGVDADSLNREDVRRNKEKAYCDLNNPIKSDESPGRLLFLQHEVMISRFHAMLELACTESQGRVELVDFQQGSRLYQKVEVPRLSATDGHWAEKEETEYLPHRPDAFFSLSVSSRAEPLHFFYEADRHRTNAQRYNRKLRAHFHFVVKQKRHQEIYGINRIRAVLTESIDSEWADHLRHAAAHPMVSGSRPSPLFWFTSSELFTELRTDGTQGRGVPTFLKHPEIVLRKIWASPVDDTLHSLID